MLGKKIYDSSKLQRAENAWYTVAQTRALEGTASVVIQRRYTRRKGVKSAKVDILLATYNGAAFLQQQLESLLAQTHQNWRLFVRDDGSSDTTVALLQDATKQHPERFYIVEDTKGSLGATRNFAELLLHSTAEYCMFCDQDDVWLPDKIDRSLNAMLRLEEQHGNTKPILVYTDLQLVDGDLVPFAPSYWGHLSINPRERQVWNRLLIDNIASGCTMLFNRALREKAKPIDQDAALHDWWFALVASLLGVTEPLEHSTILYRQHHKNVVGVGRDLSRSFTTMFGKSSFETTRKNLKKSQKQTAAVARRYAKELDPHTLHLLETFATLDTLQPLAQRLFLVRHSMLRIGLIKNLGLLLRM